MFASKAPPIAAIIKQFVGYRLIGALDAFDLGLKEATISWDLGSVSESQDVFVLGSDNAFVRASSLTEEERASFRTLGTAPSEEAPSLAGYHQATVQFDIHRCPHSFPRDAEVPDELDAETSQLVWQRMADVVAEMRHTHASLLHPESLERMASSIPSSASGHVLAPVTLDPENCVLEFQLEVMPTGRKFWPVARHVTLPGGAPVPLLPVTFSSRGALLDYFEMTTRLSVLHQSRMKRRREAARRERAKGDDCVKRDDAGGDAIQHGGGGPFSPIDMA